MFKFTFFNIFQKSDKDMIISLMRSLNKINYINNGWCLFAAYAVYLKAQELWIKGVSLVQIDYGSNNYIPKNKAFLKWDIDTPVSWNHYALNVWWDIIDSTWIFKWIGCKTFIIKGHSDIHKLSITSLQKWNWNNKFNRYNGVTKIRKILWIDLKHCL